MLLYRDLSDPERLLVAALRRAGANGAARALASDATALLGEREADASVPLLAELGDILRCGGRRPMGHPCAGMALCAHELQLLQIVAAAQACDEDRLEAHLLWAVGPDSRTRLAAIARTIALRWARRGHLIRSRRPSLVSAPNHGRSAAPHGA